MKVIQIDERTYKVYLNDDEFSDLKVEASRSQISLLDVMKAIFLMTFVQVMSCRFFRRQLHLCKGEKTPDEKHPFRHSGD